MTGGRAQKQHWYMFFVSVLFIASLGAAWEWRQTQFFTKNVESKVDTKIQPQKFALPPKLFKSHETFLLNNLGPIQNKDILARQKTRQLVKQDRSNVNCKHMKCLALTFDDGPEPGLTNKLLHILEKRNAVGTFFVLGSRVPDQADTMKQIVKGRHEIGNHTWTHRDLTTLPEHDIKGELDRTETTIMQTIGVRPLLMRPPMGAYDDRVAAAVQMPLALWTVDPYDWRDRDTQILQKRILEGVGTGKIILLHDTYPETIQAMPDTIDELQRRGYVLVTVSELFGITQKNVQTFNGRILRHQ